MLTEEQKKDVIFIQRAGYWPNWPYLPMKKYDPKEGLIAGTLLDKQELGKPLDLKHESMRKVYLVSVWAVARGEGSFKTYETKLYNSIEEMLQDGWQVD
jgi:hypothetical protein